MDTPPIAMERSHVIEIHGTKLIDDYYWLRDKENPEVIKYLEAENDYTESMMSHTTELQKKLFEEMKMRMIEDDASVPIKHGKYYYYSRVEKGKNYRIYCRKYQNLENPEEVVLDLNELAQSKGYLDLGYLDWTPNHNKILYSLDYSGYERYEVFVKDVKTNEVMNTSIKDSGPIVRFNSNGSKIYYLERDEINRLSKLKLHTLGSTSQPSTLLYEDDPQFMLDTYFSTDRRYLFVESNHRETDKIYFVDLVKDDEKVLKFNDVELDMEFQLDHYNGYFFFKTTDQALNGRVMKTPVTSLDKPNWEEVKAHDDIVLISSIRILGDHLIVYSKREALGQIEILSLKNNEWESISFEEPIFHVYPYSRRQNYDVDNKLLRLYYSSPITPKRVYDFDLHSKKLIKRKEDEIPEFNRDNYTTRREYAIARDGEQIPVSLIMQTHITQDGKNPLVLFGYGSYGYSYETAFVSNNISLLERGVIIGIAHIRGGSEKGKSWYHKGRMFKKNNTFYDFIDCAKYLIDKKYTNSNKLGITGGSAGGLLMGAVVNFAPELFKTVLARVPFVDVIQTMLDDTIPLTTFEWTEWGNPKVPEEFKYMYSYSPYDQVKPKAYPSMLVTTGLNDPRVAYWEPAKWVAKLRKLKTDNNILLLQTNMGAGHSGASGRYDLLKEKAFQYAFLLDQLGIIT